MNLVLVLLVQFYNIFFLEEIVVYLNIIQLDKDFSFLDLYLLNPKSIGGWRLNTQQLSKSSITQRIHLDATLNFSYMADFLGPQNPYGIWKSQEVSGRGRLKTIVKRAPL